MSRWKVPIIVFVVTAVVVDAILYAANVLFPGPLFWPGVVVAFPGIPFILVGDLVLPSLHAFYSFVFPAAVWGFIAAGIASLVGRKKVK